MMVDTSTSLRDLFTLLSIGFAHPQETFVEGVASGDYQRDLETCLRELGENEAADQVFELTADLTLTPDLKTRLAAEHFRLFVGSRTAVVSPYESMLRAEIKGEEGLVMLAGSALDAQKAYERFGFTAPGQEPPDNIHYQTQFIALLLEKIDEGDIDARREFNRYVTAHFTTWVEHFVTKLHEESNEGLYAALAVAFGAAVDHARSTVQ